MARTRARLTALLAAALLAAGCGGAPAPEVGGRGDGTGEVTLWFHTGTGPERTLLEDQVSRFNALGTGVTVRTVRLPVGDYGRQLEAAVRADRLPDLMDADPTALAGLVRDRAIVPLDGGAGAAGLLAPASTADLTDSVRTNGTVDGRLYGLGRTDATVVLFVNRGLARAAGVRLPTGLADAWTAAEFDAALTRLAAADEDGRVLDLRLSEAVEPGPGRQVTGWWAYAFGPVVWSAGGDLLDRPANGTARGRLDSPAVAAAVGRLASWRDLVATDPRDGSFRTGEVAVSWSSTRSHGPYAAALGRQLAVVPLPDFGTGVRSSQGSWTWVVAARSPRQQAAARFLDFLLTPAEVALAARAAGEVPGTRAALAAAPAYRPGGPLALAAEQLNRTCGTGPIRPGCVAVPRPVTAGWNTVRTEFGEALRAALGGEDAAAALTAATGRIEADFAEHDGYRLR